LRETAIEDTEPHEDGEYGFGILVFGGASLDGDGCEVEGNNAVGVAAVGGDTWVTLRDTRVAATTRGEIQTVGIGIVAQESATVETTGVEVSSNEGPGLYSLDEGSLLSCSGCVLRDNQFAGAVVVSGAALRIEDSSIEDTVQQENIGGRVGIFAEPWYGEPPALSVSGTTIQDNPVAGIWLSGEGSYWLSGNTIHGGDGWSREGLTKCGDAVYVRDGVEAWDGSSGLLLENNELLDGQGAGLFLDNASATLSSNSYETNAVDLVVQGSDCDTPPDGYDSEALGYAELCPTYDYATCGDEFTLYLTLEEPETGHGAPLMHPGLFDPDVLPLPVLPDIRLRRPDIAPLVPPVPNAEPPKLRPG